MYVAIVGWRSGPVATNRKSPSHPIGNATNSIAVATRPSNDSGARGLAQHGDAGIHRRQRGSGLGWGIPPWLDPAVYSSFSNR
jgi:hypothetical protein